MRFIIVAAAAVLLATGCANDADYSMYMAAQERQNNTIVQAISDQTTANAKARDAQLVSFLTTVQNAAPENKALMAMAIGYAMGKEQRVEIPKLTPIKAPPTNLDYAKVWVPFAGNALGMVNGWAMLWATDSFGGSSDGASYVADNGGTVVVGSGNPGSYNTVGGDNSLTNTQSDYSIVDNCVDCGTSSEEELSAMGTSGEVEDPDETPASCGTSGGDYRDGTWYLNEFSGCSCASREAGRC